MSDFILIDADQAIFQPSFGSATVIPLPGQIAASGAASLNGVKVCIEGDESSVEVAGVTYFTAQYSIPGTGTLLIDSLAADQVAEHTRSSETLVILKGSNFTAKFKVDSPAQQPPPGPGSPIPDSMTEYSGGQGSFITSNTKFKGS